MRPWTPRGCREVAENMRLTHDGYADAFDFIAAAWEADLERVRVELGTQERIHKLTIAGFQERQEADCARIEALERERVEAEKKIAVAKAFVDDGVPISFEELGPTCACCREDYESRREPPYDEGNPNQPYKQVDATKHTADCVWDALVIVLATKEKR